MEWLKKLRGPKFYRYFFYRQYVFSKSVWDTDAAFSAMLMIALTMVFHVTSLSIVIGEIFKINIIDFFFTDRGSFEIIGYGLIFLIVAYALFYYNGKWSKIIQEFEGESEKQRILGKYCLFIYLLAYWGFYGDCFGILKQPASLAYNH